MCGSDNKTYLNSCEAKIAGIVNVTKGHCFEYCPDVLDYVCGSDTVTYNNDCEAKQAGIFYYSPGKCNETCTSEDAPVCGSDDVTYTNNCFAKKAGILKYAEGKCADADLSDSFTDINSITVKRLWLDTMNIVTKVSSVEPSGIQAPDQEHYKRTFWINHKKQSVIYMSEYYTGQYAGVITRDTIVYGQSVYEEFHKTMSGEYYAEQQLYCIQAGCDFVPADVPKIEVSYSNNSISGYFYEVPASDIIFGEQFSNLVRKYHNFSQHTLF